jgi:hypothetical protein
MKTGQAVFYRTDSSLLGRSRAYCYFPEDTNYSVILKEICLSKLLALIKIIGLVFEKMTVLFMEIPVKSP